jgi:MFS family permease
VTSTVTSPGESAVEQRRLLVIIGALLLGMLLAALDQTIVATALPTIAGDLHGLSDLSWIVTSYIPTRSGLELLPLMAGLLLTSTLSGILISRWGRYKVFPIVGTALMTVGMYLLSRLGVATGTLASSAYMFVLGVGIGAVMQVLVIAVQNVVPYSDLASRPRA